MNEKPIAAGKSSFDLIDVKTLFQELSLREDAVFLDVACGTGMYSIAASDHIGSEGRIYAVDLWQDGIDSVKKEIKAGHISNIQAIVADVSKRIPVEDQVVDVCLMATVLHDLIQDKTEKGTLNELRRVMKPKGILAVIEFKKIEGPPGPPLAIRISPEEVETHLHPYAFRLMKTVNIGPYNYLSLFTARPG